MTRQRTWGLVFVVSIVLITLVLSWSSFSHAFLSDDFEWVSVARSHVESRAWLEPFSEKIGGDFYRPLATIGFQLDYALFGFEPTGYYIHQWVFHVLLILLLTYFVHQMFGRFSLACIVGILFALWPSQHEVVTWLSGRPDLYAATFSMASLVTWIYALKKVTWQRWIAYLVSALFAVAAFLSKEQAVVLPLLHALVAFWILGRSTWRRYILIAIQIVVFFGILLAVILIRSHILHDVVGGYAVGKELLSTHLSFSNIGIPFASWMFLINWTYVLAEFSNIVTQAAHALYQFLLQQWYVGFVVMAGIGVWLWRARTKKFLCSPYVFGWVFALVSFVPVYSLANAIGESLENTRFVFFSSMGWAICFGTLLFGMSECKVRNKKVGLIFLLLLFAATAGLWRLNSIPWNAASERVSDVLQALTDQRKEITKHNPTDIIVGDLPTSVYGAYAFYRLHSIKEAAYMSGYTTQMINQYGSVKPWPGPFCDRKNAENIQAVFWNSAQKQFAVMDSQTLSRLAIVGEERVWDFAESSIEHEWRVSGSEARWTTEGLRIDLNRSTYITSLNWPVEFLGAYRWVEFTFDVVEEGNQFGDHTLTMQWTDDGTYTYDATLEYPVKQESSVILKIPVCSYSNWMLSDGVSTFRFRPLEAGSVIVRSARLIP